MKYIKQFEGKGRYSKKIKFEYLSPDDEKKIEDFVKSYLDELNILDKVNKLSYNDFDSVDFNYKDVFDNMIAPTHYGFENIYYAVDTFCRHFNLNYSTPALRNSLFNIIDKAYKELNSTIKLKNKLDERLIKILEEDPEDYKEIYSSEYKKLSGAVKKACAWMLNYQKYNL